MRWYKEDDIPNMLPCKSCKCCGCKYQLINLNSYPNVKCGTWYTITNYLCVNCNTDNQFIWQMGDWERGILGKWNGEELPSEKHIENYEECH